MQEDFLHYIWKFRKFCSPKLKTSSGEIIKVFNPGIHNFNSGPDFIGALLVINEINGLVILSYMLIPLIGINTNIH